MFEETSGAWLQQNVSFKGRLYEIRLNEIMSRDHTKNGTGYSKGPSESRTFDAVEALSHTIKPNYQKLAEPLSAEEQARLLVSSPTDLIRQRGKKKEGVINVGGFIGKKKSSSKNHEALLNDNLFVQMSPYLSSRIQLMERRRNLELLKPNPYKVPTDTKSCILRKMVQAFERANKPQGTKADIIVSKKDVIPVRLLASKSFYQSGSKLILPSRTRFGSETRALESPELSQDRMMKTHARHSFAQGFFPSVKSMNALNRTHMTLDSSAQSPALIPSSPLKKKRLHDRSLSQLPPSYEMSGTAIGSRQIGRYSIIEPPASVSNMTLPHSPQDKRIRHVSSFTMEPDI